MGEHNPWMEIQWIFSFAILSIPVVPAYAGLEYWLLMFGSIFVVRFLIRDIHPDTQEPNASSSIQSPASADSTG